MRFARALAFVPMLTLTGCGVAVYSPLKLDETGGYKTSSKLEEGDVQVRKVGVDLAKYRFAYLTTDTNLNPSRLGFFVRSVLAREGLTRVYDKDELTRWVTTDPKLAGIPSISDPVALQRLSQQVGPVLKVDYVARWTEVRQDITLTVTDLSSGEVLFKVNNARMIWANVDTEAHYPVFNELQRWVKDNRRPAGGSI